MNSKAKYKAVLFHPEGDSVTDFRDRSNIQEVWEELAEMGSRWIFYPIVFVATEKTVADAPEGLEFLKGKRIKTVAKFLKQAWKERSEEISRLLNAGAPLEHIYN